MAIAVCAWYSHGNLGDEAFKPAFRTLFEGDLEFFDAIPANVNDYQALILGGGSFLDQPYPGSHINDIHIPIGLIGTGIHEIHPSNQHLVDGASIIVCRNKQDLVPALEAPDLLYIREFPLQERVDKKLTVLTNGFMLPRPDGPPWQALAWSNFNKPFRDVLVQYLKEGWSVNLLPMCASHDIPPFDDRIASSLLAEGTGLSSWTYPLSEGKLVKEIASSSLVFSTRFHGCVLSALTQTPFVGLSVHDKMASYFRDNEWHNCLDAYQFTPGRLEAAIQNIPSADELRGHAEKGKARWFELQDTIKARLSL